MARSLLGLDVGTSAVRVAEVSRKTDPPTLERFVSVPLPRGAVADGEIVDVPAVAAAVKEAFRRGRFSVRRTALGIANQKVVVRQVDLPFMDEGDLQGALQFQAQEHIPIPIEDAILDFQVLEEVPQESGDRMLRVLLVAAQRDMVHSYVAAAQEAGLDPAVVDLSSFADLRALGSSVPLLGAREGEALIDIGAGVTNVIVHEQGKPRFVRILPMGGDDISDALSTGLQIGWEEAEELKARVGLSHEGTAGGGDGAARVIEQRASAFVDEVRGSIDYYLSQTGSAQINTVIITGGGAKLSGLIERLSTVLHVGVEEGQALARVRLGKLAQTPDELAQLSSRAAVAIGLALRED